MNTSEDIEVRILEQTPDDLEAYGSVPIAFEVQSILRVNFVGINGIGGLSLNEEEVASPWPGLKTTTSMRDRFAGGSGTYRIGEFCLPLSKRKELVVQLWLSTQPIWSSWETETIMHHSGIFALPRNFEGME